MIADAARREAAARKLRGLIHQHDAVARRLAKIDRDLQAAKALYADAAGFRAIPRLECLRREVGA